MEARIRVFISYSHSDRKLAEKIAQIVTEAEDAVQNHPRMISAMSKIAYKTPEIAQA